MSGDWIRVAECDAVPVREGRAVTVGDREIALFNLGDRFLAVDNRCPHQGGPLCDGIVTGTSVVCPLHSWKVDLETGVVNRGETNRCVTAYRTQVVDGLVLLERTPPAIAGGTAASPPAVSASDGGDGQLVAAGRVFREMGERLVGAEPRQAVLDRAVQFLADVLQCDSCLVYVLEERELVLRGAQASHADQIGRVRMPLGQGIAGWVAQHRTPVAIGRRAYEDQRFRRLGTLAVDRLEALLSVPVVVRRDVVGVIDVRHRHSRAYPQADVDLVSGVACFVAAAIAMDRLATSNAELTQGLETRKLLERAKGILQRDLGLTEEEAYLRIQKQSRQRSTSKRDVAEGIILADEQRRRPTDGSVMGSGVARVGGSGA